MPLPAILQEGNQVIPIKFNPFSGHPLDENLLVPGARDPKHWRSPINDNAWVYDPWVGGSRDLRSRTLDPQGVLLELRIAERQATSAPVPLELSAIEQEFLSILQEYQANPLRPSNAFSRMRRLCERLMNDRRNAAIQECS